MDTWTGLLQGLSTALTPGNLLAVTIGVLVGMVIGVLPGLGPTATMAMLLPVTFTMEPTTAVIMLAGIYYGSMYGGTITTILVNVPGEVASVVTALDGYALARQGRAGPALGIAAVGSFIGGVVAVLALVVLATPLIELSRNFGPPEIFLIALIGLALVVAIASGRPVRAMIAACVGLVVATVGQDPLTGVGRFTFGSLELNSGIDIVAVAMGLFGIGEIVYRMKGAETPVKVPRGLRGAYPTRGDLVASAPAIARGSVIGSLIGLLPGGGGVLSSMTSYAVEKRLAKKPERFGKGAIEGVAGPETANNAGSQTGFLPLLTLGLPTSAVMALVYGALQIQGITPGPKFVQDSPEIFWGIIASMLIGNAILLFLNVPLMGAFAQLLRVPMVVIGVVTIMISLVGVYALNNEPFDVLVAICAGVIGYFMRRWGYEAGPVVLAGIIGVLLEVNLRRMMSMSTNGLGILLERPLTIGLLIIFGAAIVLSILAVRRGRKGFDINEGAD
ncbi:transporter [Pseudarthrobacter sulfonivorans]|uniref:Transporter n=1 Tax=Pseudarthrobacter sulfonivorans TaxID=121292 RepID=A0A0U3FM30_9MICC|nr:tripartite tricarboxylate transporter permease [Pseudarthrobacter sulfonivorans]ALV39927.1 transporter [Pseudarthrobacter sulfonivorans]